MTKGGPVWRNWAANQVCAPASIAKPGTHDELVAVVEQAAARRQRLKVVGAGHSFTDIACTDGVLVRLDNFDRVLEVDRERRLVTAEAGIRLSTLNSELGARGLALENLGDIAYQTLAGAISTGTHGTGAKLGGLAAQVVGLEIITATGAVLSCSAEEEADVFQAARVGLGAIGVISTVTLRCVPAFSLEAVEEPMRLDHVLDHLDEYVDGNDHFEFFWVPHTGWALTKRNNRTDRPVGGRTWGDEVRDRLFWENVAFGAVCRAGRLRPSMIPRLSRMLPNTGRREYVDRSYRVMTSPRLVHFYEMEYSIPRDQVAGALRSVVEWVNRSGMRISFPVEVRFVAPDDIALSTSTGRPSGYLAVHVYWGMPYEQYFRAVEAIMDPLGGRPHWGKLHYQTAATLAPKYPAWDRWQAVRRRLDPDGLLANAYTDRVVGPLP